MDEFPLEYVKPFKYSFKLLSRSHIYLFEDKISSTLKNLLSFIFLIIFVLCGLSYYISLVVYMSKAFSGDIEFFELAFIVPVFMVATQGILKATIVLSKKYKIRAIILKLGTMWRMDNLSGPQIEKKKCMLKRLNICNGVFYWMNVVGSWQYMIVPLFETLFKRFILQQQSELLFPFGCSFPFDPTKTWTRYIAVYVFETYSMLHLIYLYLGPEFLMITLCAHLSTEFILLQEDLRDVKPMSSKNRAGDVIGQNKDIDANEIVSTEKGDNNIKDIVRRHQVMIMLSNQLDEIFNIMIFINLLFASVTICFFGFVATMSRGPADMANNFVGVCASMLPIFNLCYFGELLTGASVGVADSAYENKWYNGDVKFQKMMFFIIKRSQRPCCLTSLKYTKVSLPTFTTVMSTTYSYFSLATSVYDDKK